MIRRPPISRRVTHVVAIIVVAACLASLGFGLALFGAWMADR